MKPISGSLTTSAAYPKSITRVKRASGIASGSIHIAITLSTPGRYRNGGSDQSNKGSPELDSVGLRMQTKQYLTGVPLLRRVLGDKVRDHLVLERNRQRVSMEFRKRHTSTPPKNKGE